ncbi:hypothetical protein BN11_3790001 [Nostocoides australiense Ben110]|uniref:Uncharacterized protein n=1 Tax=Nostocoides australiense Ben110 TaxID=1193182 RepID=W6JY58_9MICO|nr:hypothetical protein BN11_3790001 [Tetrasphaera australiensis Ben110]
MDQPTLTGGPHTKRLTADVSNGLTPSGALLGRYDTARLCCCDRGQEDQQAVAIKHQEGDDGVSLARSNDQNLWMALGEVT